ncbi:hypothetical protein [Actinokineospora bangkokensis]|uniref:Uncharacterized protein n=1 Tax=Actinokineospora bangkokensis TaxID=1193682 RepID=A0A1Q9LTD4_9PSEU|nr:hypothetical protein [Actinokineospora bangkokensis]OLR95261.1 hypothetical protein BJP25_07170 [Actinokineospora bangkokensis]
MTFTWRYEDGDGQPVDGPAERFDDQSEAEEWFSSVWPDLHHAGVVQVTLLEDGTEVYGPMPLSAQ